MESSPAETKACQTCKVSQDDLERCVRCKNVFYCGVQCQKKDWPSHKLTCSKVTAKLPESKEDLLGMNQFHKVQHLGTGNFTTIFKGVSKKDGKIYAIKQAEKAKLTRVRKEADLFMEKHCLGKLKECKYAVRLWQTFQDEMHLFLKMDCLEGGQLWDKARFFGLTGESVYRYYISHIIKAVHSIHEEYQIVHRDLKPENIMLTKDNEVKLIDFGTAKDLERPDIKGSGNGLKGKKQFDNYVGTPQYMAPECIHNKASEKISDVYSLSGILYFLKVGSAPFCAGSEYLIFKKSLQNEMVLPSELFSPQLTDLILKMNAKEMGDRISLNEVMKHEYFEGIDFNKLPTYQQAFSEVTPFENVVGEIREHLIQTYASVHKEQTENRGKIYHNDIVPFLQKWLQKCPEEMAETSKKLVEVIEAQTAVMINLSDDLNVSFAELYRTLRNIEAPVIENPINEKEEETEEVDLEKGAPEPEAEEIVTEKGAAEPKTEDIVTN